jgi:hypothetical protein
MSAPPNGPKFFPAVINRLFFSEPQGGRLNWILFLLGTASVLIWPVIDPGFFAQFGMLFIWMASIFWFESLAEIFPKGQWKLAGIVRILGWVIFWGGLVYFYITFAVAK